MQASELIQDITANVIAGIITAAIAGLFGLLLRLYMRRHDREVKKRELIVDIKNKTYRPKPLVILYVITQLQFMWTIVLFTVIPLVQYYAGTRDYAVATPLNLFLTLLVMGAVTIPISIYMNHRLKKSEWWLNVGIVICTFIFTVVEISVLLRDFPSLEHLDAMLFLLGCVMVFLLPALYLGRFLAERKQSQFIMMQLFKQLPDSDKRRLIELVDSLPSTSEK